MVDLSGQDYINLLNNLKDAAEEISRDDPEMLRSFSDFCSVMWTDDAIVELLGETYTQALHKAYHELRERREVVRPHHSLAGNERGNNNK